MYCYDCAFVSVFCCFFFFRVCVWCGEYWIDFSFKKFIKMIISLNRDMSEVGMNAEFEGTPPYVMEETLKYLKTKYGSIPRLMLLVFGGVWWCWCCVVVREGILFLGLY